MSAAEQVEVAEPGGHGLGHLVEVGEAEHERGLGQRLPALPLSDDRDVDDRAADCDGECPERDGHDYRVHGLLPFLATAPRR